MCQLGCPKKTDKSLAQEARRYMQGLVACMAELDKRGYTCMIRSGSSYAVAWPVSIEIKKEVSL